MKFNQLLTLLDESTIHVDKHLIDDIRKVINQHKSSMIGKSSITIAKTLNNILSKFNISVKPYFFNNDKLLDAFTGEFGSISILLAQNIDSLLTDEDGWVSFNILLLTYIEHELIHREQFRQTRESMSAEKYDKFVSKRMNKSNYTTLEGFVNYLSDPYEIMAFANTAVRELQRLKYTNSDILKKIKTKHGLEESATLHAYMEIAKVPTIVLNQLIEYMIEYLNEDN